MSGINFIDTVTRIPSDWANTVNKTVFDVLGEPQNIEDVRTRLRLASMSEQSHEDVRILGGYIEGANLGSRIPLTSVTANRIQTPYTPTANTDVVTLGYYTGDVANRLAGALATFAGNLGSMSQQNSSLVTINGGTINGVAIGGTVPVTGVFTALKVNTFPTTAQDVLSKGWFDATYGTLLGNLGTLSQQNSTNLQATGGALNSVTVGLANPAAGRFTTLSVQTTPTSPTDAANKLYVDTAVNNISLSVGTLGLQNANAIAATGGTINGVSIGATSASTIKATSLDVSNTVLPAVRVTALGSAVSTSLVFNNGSADTGQVQWITASHPTVSLRNAMHISSSTDLNLWAGGNQLAKISATAFEVTTNLRSGNVALGAATNDAYHRLNSDAPLRARGLNRNYAHITANSGSTILDFATAHVWGVDLNVNTTLVFDNGTTTSAQNFDQHIRLYFKQTGVATRSVTWPISVRWVSATSFPAAAPDFTTGAVNGLHVVDLHSIDNGVTWIAQSVAGTNSI